MNGNWEIGRLGGWEIRIISCLLDVPFSIKILSFQ
jgi:hypothetical protein